MTESSSKTKISYSKKIPKMATKYILMSFILIFVFFAALFLGSTYISIKDALNGLFGDSSSTASVIMLHFRLPRVLSAMLAGIGLSISGVLLQSITDNRLASPNIIGVNSGAGLAVIAIMSFFPQLILFTPLAAFLGALATTFIILLISGRIGQTKISVILAGMALTSILNSCISLISLIDTDVVSSYNFFSVGGLSGVSSKQLTIPAILIFISLAVSLLLSSKINLLGLGDGIAASLGVRVKLLRIICIICACASAASVVSFAGLLGFAGLIVPNIARRIVGENIFFKLSASALIGSSLLIFADMLGRIMFAPSEIPVGIVMALIGSPFFLAILLRGNKNV